MLGGEGRRVCSRGVPCVTCVACPAHTPDQCLSTFQAKMGEAGYANTRLRLKPTQITIILIVIIYNDKSPSSLLNFW